MRLPSLPYIPHLIATVSGLLVCRTISYFTGSKEAWDSGVYFSIGIPVMSTIVAVLSYCEPNRPWRWTVCMAAGQSVAILMAGNSLSLWPLSLVVMAVLSMPQFLAGLAGSQFAIRTGRS